jgi:addiction module HigA family antidote
MPMKNPPHPGLSVRLDCLEPLGLSVTEGAKALGVTRQALNNLVNGKNGISPEMAIRLDKSKERSVRSTDAKLRWSFASNERPKRKRRAGGGAEVWLGLQMDYDLVQAMKRERAIRGEASEIGGVILI